MSKNVHAQKVSSRSQFPIIAPVVGLALVIVVGAIGWLVWQNSRTNVGAQLGHVAPDFSVPTLDRKTFTLSEQRGKPTVIFFMAYWCSSCIPEATALGKLKQEYGDKISIAAVNVDPSTTWETIEQFKQAAGNGALVWASDTDQKVTLAYQVQTLDTTLILDNTGRVMYRSETRMTYETLKAELEKLIQ